MKFTTTTTTKLSQMSTAQNSVMSSQSDYQSSKHSTLQPCNQLYWWVAYWGMPCKTVCLFPFIKHGFTILIYLKEKILALMNFQAQQRQKTHPRAKSKLCTYAREIPCCLTQESSVMVSLSEAFTCKMNVCSSEAGWTFWKTSWSNAKKSPTYLHGV